MLFALSMTMASGEIQQQGEQTINFAPTAASAVESRLRRAPATTAPAAGFFGGGFMQFLMQALCLQITAGGGLGGGGAGLGPLLLGGGLGGGLGPLLLGMGRKRRGAGGRGGGRGGSRGNRPRPFPSTPNFGFNSGYNSAYNSGGAMGMLQNNMISSLGIGRSQTPAQILANPRVRALLASNPRTSQQLNNAMANQAVGGAGGGGGGGITTDQLVNLVMQAMCLQQQAAAATPLPAALNNRPRPGRG